MLLAHNAAQLGLPVDPMDLYDPPDLDYVLAVEMIVDRLDETQERARQEQARQQ